MLMFYVHDSVFISPSTLHFCRLKLSNFMQLLYELCVDPLTSAPTMDLLSTKKYQFYVKVLFLYHDDML